jgi:hypothetical protein
MLDDSQGKKKYLYVCVCVCVCLKLKSYLSFGLLDLADKPGFYASVYVSDDKLMTHQSIPGVETSPLTLGVPVSFITNDVKTMRPIPIGYDLLTIHLRNTGLDWIGDGDIQKKIKCIAKEEKVREWTMGQWQSNVFDGYIPCSIPYEDPEVIRLMSSDEYCHMVFTHESAKDKICLEKNISGKNGVHSAQEYVNLIIDVLHEGKPPPITHVHADRILDIPPFPGMKMPNKQIKTFDAARVNASIDGKLKGLVRVARISTQMGCVTTLCLAKKSDMPKIAEILMTWAKPIIAAQQLKAQVGLQCRMELEGINEKVNNNKSKAANVHVGLDVGHFKLWEGK